MHSYCAHCHAINSVPPVISGFVWSFTRLYDCLGMCACMPLGEVHTVLRRSPIQMRCTCVQSSVCCLSTVLHDSGFITNCWSDSVTAACPPFINYLLEFHAINTHAIWYRFARLSLFFSFTLFFLCCIFSFSFFELMHVQKCTWHAAGVSKMLNTCRKVAPCGWAHHLQTTPCAWPTRQTPCS